MVDYRFQWRYYYRLWRILDKDFFLCPILKPSKKELNVSGPSFSLNEGGRFLLYTILTIFAVKITVHLILIVFFSFPHVAPLILIGHPQPI